MTSSASASFVFSPPESVPASWNTRSPRKPEHAEQPAQILVGEAGLLADVLDDGATGPDALVLLRVVAHRHVVPEPDLAQLGFDLADERAEQGGLARAVETEHEEAFAAADVEGDVLEHDLRAERLGEVLDLEHDLARARRLGELHLERAFRLRRLHLLASHALDAGVERLGRAGPALRSGGASRRRATSSRLDLRLLAGRELAAPFLVLLPRDEVLRVRALVLDELALVEVQDRA